MTRSSPRYHRPSQQLNQDQLQPLMENAAAEQEAKQQDGNGLEMRQMNGSVPGVDAAASAARTTATIHDETTTSKGCNGSGAANGASKNGVEKTALSGESNGLLQPAK